MSGRTVIRATTIAFVLLWTAVASTWAQTPSSNGDDVDDMVTRATRLRQLNRKAKAAEVLARAVALAPDRADVRKLHQLLAFEVNGWEATVGGDYREWDDNRDSWREGHVALQRNTKAGPIVVRASQVERSGNRDEKLELELYPAFRGGYLALGGSYAPDATLYPTSAISGELFTSLPAQLEISAGYRRLNFSDALNVVTGSLGKYYGGFLFATRVNHFIDYGTSVSLLARRYLSDDGQYVGIRGTTGSAPELIREPTDFDVISSRSIGVEGRFILGSRWVVRAQGDFGREEWPGGRTANFTYGSVGLGVRF